MNKLLQIISEKDISKRQDMLIEIIRHSGVKNFKNKNFFRNFTLIYPEWALNFKYIDDFKRFLEEKYNKKLPVTKKKVKSHKIKVPKEGKSRLGSGKINVP